MSQYEWSTDELDSGGNWDSRILGSIATNLTQLKTWDQAIKELVQNADDAKATEITFSISDIGLLVYNNKLMTFCDFPNDGYKSCNFEEKNSNDFCDVHAIKTLSSQNKRKNSDATGKFGIGFVSTFLFTDQPSITSGNLRMTFLPAESKIPVKLVPEHEAGTSLYLPWATEPDSQIRLGLEKPAITLEQIPGIVSEIVASCERSFIFVRHLRSIKVSVNSGVQLHLLKEKNDDEILITDVLKSRSTSWLLLKSDRTSESKLEEIRISDRNFESRRNEFEILIPKEIDEEFSGLLYATLATNQRTFLPFHINADFYPDTSRNNLSFRDRGNERDPAALWNKSVISQCAKFVASKFPYIQDLAGNKIVWKMLRGSYAIAKQKTGEIVPECFNDFWWEFRSVASLTPVIEDQNSAFCLPTEINLLIPHHKKHVYIMNHLGLSFQKETDPIYLDICREIGSKVISQSEIARSLVSKSLSGKHDHFLKGEEILDCLYSLIEKTLQYENVVIDQLQELPIWLTSSDTFVNFETLNGLSSTFDKVVFSNLFPNMTLSSSIFSTSVGLQELIRPITGDLLVTFLKKDENQSGFLLSQFFHQDTAFAFDFLFRLISDGHLSESSINHLREMTIWPHSNGQYQNLVNSTLPGSFIDPIGVGKLLDRKRLGHYASEALARDLRVKELSLEVYVSDLLPVFFSSHEIDSSQAQDLTIQFVNHQDDLNEHMIRKLQTFPFVVVTGNRFLTPQSCLFPNESLQKFCSTQYFGFVDINILGALQFDNDKKLDGFLRKIGVVFDVNLELLVSSWRYIQEDIENRDSEIQRLTSIAEGLLELFQKKARGIRLLEGIPPTANLIWPCKVGCKSWHSPSELIQSKWSRVICNLENLHEVGITFGKRNRELIQEVFAISNKPDTLKVNEHLQHCIMEGRHPGDSFYGFLNWLSDEGDSFEKKQVEFLRDVPLIFQDGSFWIPRDIYLSIPSNLIFLASFVHYVEKPPKGLEALWSTLGIGAVSESDVTRYLPEIKNEIVSGGYKEVDVSRYLSALSIIGTSYETRELWALNFLDEFRDSEYLLTFSGLWIKPEHSVIADNEDWAYALSEHFASNLVRIEAAAFEFLVAAGAKRLTDALEVHEESLSIMGDPDFVLTRDFQERSEEIYALLANQLIDSPGGSMQVYETAIPRLEKMQQLTINPVSNIQVRVTLSIKEDPQSVEISNSPPLYLSSSNAVIFVRNEKEPILAIFSAILFEVIPRLTTDKILDSASKFLMIMKMDQSNLMDWLQTNGYLKHDISPPRNVLVKPLSINIKNRDETDEDLTGEEDMSLDTEPTFGIDESSLDEDLEIPSDNNQVRISTDSQSEPNRNLPNSRDRENHPGSSSVHPRDSSGGKADLSSFLSRSGSVSSKEVEDASGEQGQGNPPSGKRDAKSGKQNYKGKRRRSGFVHAEAEKGDGQGNIHNTAVDKAGVEWIKSKEWEIGRTVIDMNDKVKNHEGFDLMSISESNPSDVRYIEVKSCSGYWPELGVGLSRKQFETAILEGFQSWLYVVENVMESDSMKRLHRIQNPWENIRSVYFDPGWRDLAEVSPHQNPISLVKGLRILYQGKRLGWIATDPTRQGQSIHCRVLFDDSSKEEPIRWDDRYIEVVTGEDDNS